MKATESNSKKNANFVDRPFVASEIAAYASSYVHSRGKVLMSLSSPSREEDTEEDNDKDSVQTGDEPHEEEPRMYKSEVAAYVAASTMTVVVAAGEKERKETARDLQSLHSSPCEWDRTPWHLGRQTFSLNPLNLSLFSTSTASICL